ncbi:MAG: imidazole glycerol phosphate synthase subunit HisH [Chloroflexi bacterium]|nr:imidazole glycerol phosphate synthase subunit HisH [Chloroflexota bacterium]
MIAIIDYGAGNLRSVAKAIERLGYAAVVTQRAEEVLAADAVMLPGVGAAGDTMDSLTRLGLVEPIRAVVARGTPFFGVCLGLQVLLAGSEEGGWQECLDLVPGVVRRLPPTSKVPHMGWNQVRQQVSHPIFDGISDEENFYFVHSYYVDPADASLVAGQTEYGLTFCSVLIRDNLVATQFHPEKSGNPGLRMYDNFCRWSGLRKAEADGSVGPEG